MLSKDFKEFIELLRSNGVEFLVVGAHALAAHGNDLIRNKLATGRAKDLVDVESLRSGEDGA